MGLHLDDRLPDLVDIEDSNRQQARRIASHPTPCSKCLRPVTAEDLCFADGKDAHRSCAETWNWTLLDGYRTLMMQDAGLEPTSESV